jgi:putative transposase
MQAVRQHRQMLHLANHGVAAPLSRDARMRLNWVQYYRAHGNNAALTCRRFGIARSTLYRWTSRYHSRHIATLEARPKRPKNIRRATYTTEQVVAVRQLRDQFPRWGKDKLQPILAKQGMTMSVSMVGRILTHLKRTGQLKEPLRVISARKRKTKRPYAIRKPKDYEVFEPGDLAQIDTLDVRGPGFIYKHFSLVDCVSRYGLVALRGRATALTAKESLEMMLQRSPFDIKAIQVDGGSEFMAEFEEFCQQREIQLFVLPPRSPKLNGQVERSQRTHTEEFYQCTEASFTVADLAAELANWEVIYNTVRPHQSLAQLTPMEFLQANFRHLLTKEVTA